MEQRQTVVVGLGGMGAAVLEALARRGVRPLGLDRFRAGHLSGSSHGGSRVARQAYFEHPDYVPLLKWAFEGWDRLEAETGIRCLHRIGVLLAGGVDSMLLKASLASAREHGIPIESIDSSELRRRFPQFRLPDGMFGVFEPGAGFVRPEAGIDANLEFAVNRGAEIRRPVEVLGIDADDDGAVIRTDQGDIRAERVVVTAGAWTSRLLRELDSSVPLIPQRKEMVWFANRGQAACSSAGMPAWLVDDQGACGDGVYYGVPTWAGQTGHRGMKVGFHGPGVPVDPDLKHVVPQEIVDRFSRDMKRYLPEVLGEPIAAQSCLYTMSPDEHFVIDRLPGRAAVVVAAGFSGHGYKFAPVVGEIAADLAMEGRSSLPAGFLGLSRFEAEGES
jgi:sarcosine oxidase